MSEKKYKKENFKRVTWIEYSTTLETLYKKVADYIHQNKIKIDVVVPIMRGGAFPGTYLAYRLHLLAMLPIQYKYSFADGKAILKKLTDYPSHNFNVPTQPTFLLVEGNHCFGNTAQVAINDLLEKYPGCKIIYAVDHEDASCQTLKGIKANFWGKLTDETRAISETDAKKLGVEKGISYLLPWEDLDEEWTTVQGKQFIYHSAKENGEVKMELKLGEDYL